MSGLVCFTIVMSAVAGAVGYWRHRWEQDHPDEPRRRWFPPSSPPQ
jgi:uncharacterized iron-regulated membrane protein